MMVRNPIPLALVLFLSGLGIVMTLFTLLDLGSGDRSTALAIGLVAWPVVAVVGAVVAKMLNADKLPAAGSER